MAKDMTIQPRDALFGGRTEAFKSYVTTNQHQKIYCYDVVSAYPTVNALDDYAVGFRRYTDRSVEDIRNDAFIGLVKCDVVPPKDLYIPVLPERENGRLMFHLKPMTGTWTTVELRKALQKGYQITKIYAVAEYDRYKGLMKDYVGAFLQMKVENTRRYTQEECDDINREHKKIGFDFVVKPENTEKNLGLRQVAKICLNSLWGKFGQRADLDNYEYVHDHNKLISMFWNKGNIIPKTWEIISDQVVEVRYTENMDMRCQQSISQR